MGKDILHNETKLLNQTILCIKYCSLFIKSLALSELHKKDLEACKPITVIQSKM